MAVAQIADPGELTAPDLYAAPADKVLAQDNLGRDTAERVAGRALVVLVACTRNPGSRLSGLSRGTPPDDTRPSFTPAGTQGSAQGSPAVSSATVRPAPARACLALLFRDAPADTGKYRFGQTSHSSGGDGGDASRFAVLARNREQPRRAFP